MEIGNKTKITITIGTIATVLAFIIGGIIYFLDLKNDLQDRIRENEYKITSLEKEIGGKASISEIDKINIKLTNIEALLLELKTDIKSMK